jgi:hypothetical protein
MVGFEQERGRENMSFPVAELFKPRGLKERSDVRLPSSPALNERYPIVDIFCLLQWDSDIEIFYYQAKGIFLCRY